MKFSPETYPRHANRESTIRSLKAAFFGPNLAGENWLTDGLGLGGPQSNIRPSGACPP